MRNRGDPDYKPSVSERLGDKDDIMTDEDRVSLEEVRALRKDAMEVGDWAIEALVVGDNSVGKCGKKLLAGQLYAAATMGKGYEGFHIIEQESLNFAYVRGEVGFKFPARGLDSKRRNTPRWCNITAELLDFDVDSGVNWQVALRHELIAWCDRNRGVAVYLGGPGARKGYGQLAIYHVKEVEMMMSASTEIGCLRAALINAVLALRGKRDALQVFRALKNCPDQFVRLGHISPIIKSWKMKLVLRCISNQEKINLDRDGTSWLAERTAGVWLIRFRPSTYHSDHCICIDGTQRLIFDSAELHAMRLSRTALRLCGGIRSRGKHIPEVYQLQNA